MRRIIHKINVSRIICDHLLGDNHTYKHKIVVGIVIMSVGVMVSKIHTTMVTIHFLLDGIGYAIHGIGLTPIIEKLIDAVKKEKNDVMNAFKDELLTPEEALNPEEENANIK